MNRTLRAATRTKQFAQLLDSGLELASTDRQIANGSIKLVGKYKIGRRTIRPQYVVTASGAVISNEFTARRVAPTGTTTMYREAFAQVHDLLSKRLSA